MSELENVKILVAEDDEGILSLLKTFFDSQGAVVYPEENGSQVFEHVKELKPDVVLLDVVMPFVDGLTLLSQLRDSGETVPIIMLTDKNTVDDKVKGLDLGADDYMAKPFSTKELLSRVKSVLRRTDAHGFSAGDMPIEIGNIVINPLTREIIADGKTSLGVTKTEFDVLHYLALRKATVASHVDLLNDVLGYKNPIETKALVMHVANIRKKMAKAGVSGVRIETVAGVGYMIREEQGD